MSTPTFQPRRSMRLSQSSVSRYPSESPSPTPRRQRPLTRVSTPGRLPGFAREHEASQEEERSLSSRSHHHQLSQHPELDEESDDDYDELGRGGQFGSSGGVNTMNSSSSGFPKVILLKDNLKSQSFLEKLCDSSNRWRTLLDQKVTQIVLNALAILIVLFFAWQTLPWIMQSSLAFADLRFMAMVAPEFIKGLLISSSEAESHFMDAKVMSSDHLSHIDLIVNQIISNEKFGDFVRELQLQGKSGESLSSAADFNGGDNVDVHPPFQELRDALLQLQERYLSNKASMESQMNSLGKQFEELQALKEEETSKKLRAFEGQLHELNDQLGAVKDTLTRSESVAVQCESIVNDISSQTHSLVREYVNELIHDNSSISPLSIHRLQDHFVSHEDMKDILGDMKENLEAAKGSFLSSSAGYSLDEGVNIVEKALIKYDADKTGMFDFALESAGGTIVSTPCTETYDVSWAVHSVFGLPFWWERNNPRSIIQPGSQPGECWAFKGSQGSVVMELSRFVNVEAFSLEHISKMMAPERKILSAPKRFTVLGLSSLEDESPIIFGNFTYNDDGNPVQTFRVTPSHYAAIKLVELKVHSNYGHLLYTCIYRFRVHGTFADDDTESNNKSPNNNSNDN